MIGITGLATRIALITLTAFVLKNFGRGLKEKGNKYFLYSQISVSPSTLASGFRQSRLSSMMSAQDPNIAL